MKKIVSRVIQGMIMPGGWHYPINERKKLEAITFEDLIKVVAKYRADNLMPIGDVLGDIEDYICPKYPQQCHDIQGAMVTVDVTVGDSPSRAPLLDRMVEWLDHQTNKLGEEILVLDSEARRRADICKGCQFNVRWRAGCQPCNENVDRLSAMVRGGRTLLHESRLKACSCLGQENRSAVWLRIERIDNLPTLPNYCWAKR